MENKLERFSDVIAVFKTIMGNSELCKEALKYPAKVFAELGLKVDNPDYVNAHFFEANPEVKKHFLSAIAHPGIDPERVFAECESPGCIACKSALNISAGAAIAACLDVPGGRTVCMGTIAAIVHLPIGKVKGIMMTPGAKVEWVISQLCGAMGAC